MYTMQNERNPLSQDAAARAQPALAPVSMPWNSAQRVGERLRSSFDDPLTPAITLALMKLKGLSRKDVSTMAVIPEINLDGWLDGDQPILGTRHMEKLQLVLGVEGCSLMADRAHILKVGAGSAAHMKALETLSEVIAGSRVFMVSTEDKPMPGLYALLTPKGACALIICARKSMLSPYLEPGKDIPESKWALDKRDESILVVDRDVYQCAVTTATSLGGSSMDQDAAAKIIFEAGRKAIEISTPWFKTAKP